MSIQPTFRQAQNMMKCPKSFMKYFIRTSIDTISNRTSNQINLLNSICQFFTWIPLNWSLQWSIKREDYVANHPMEDRHSQDHLLSLCNNAKQKKNTAHFRLKENKWMHHILQEIFFELFWENFLLTAYVFVKRRPDKIDLQIQTLQRWSDCSKHKYKCLFSFESTFENAVFKRKINALGLWSCHCWKII